MGLKLLFVCTGNTCRSPMAEGLARKIFNDGVEAMSAGLEAWEGDGASPQALQVLLDYGIDLSSHQSRKVSDDLLAWADWVIPMTKAQEMRLSNAYPDYRHKIQCLADWGEDGHDISDPWGGSFTEYKNCADEIQKMLFIIKDKLKPVG